MAVGHPASSGIDILIEYPPNPPGLPSLDYSLKQRRRAISVSCAIVIFDFCLLPVVLFYALWFGTSLSPENGVFELP